MKRRLSGRTIFWLAALSIAAGTLMGVALVVLTLHNREVDRNLDIAEVYARIFVEQLARSIDTTGIILSGLGDDALSQDEALVQKAFDAAQRDAPFLRSLSFLDDDGAVVASSNSRNLGHRIATESLPRFASAEAGVVHLGRPWTGRDLNEGRPVADGQVAPAGDPAFVLASTLVNLRDGRRITGVAAINSDYFVNAFDQFVPLAQGQVEVIRSDGVLLFTTGNRIAPGATIDLGWLAAGGANPESGRVVRDLPDGLTELTAYRRALNHPFVTVVTLDEQPALQSWHKEAAVLLVSSSAAVLLALLIANTVFLRLRAATHQKDHALREVRQSEAHISQLLSNLPGSAYRLLNDGSGTLVFATVGDHDLLDVGQDGRVETQRRLPELIHPSDLDGYRQRVQACAESGQPYDVEYRIGRDDGRWTWVRDQGSLISGPGGTPGWLEGFVSDISASRSAEEALSAAESRYRSTLEGMLEGVAIVSSDWRFLFVNDEVTRQLGKSKDQLTGRTLQEELPGVEATPFFRKARHVMEQRQPVTIESELVRVDGVRGWFEVRMLPAEEGLVLMSIDIAERRRSEHEQEADRQEMERQVLLRTEALEQARNEADVANRAKSSFLAAMSHEIRTPMNGVIGMIDVLLKSRLKKEQIEVVSTVRESAYALLHVVDDVLDFSKIEAGQFEIDAEPFDVEAVVEAACDSVPAAQKSSGTLTLFTDPEIPRWVIGDGTRLRQVLLNLIGNAVKFSDSINRESRVHVRAEVARHDHDRVDLAISVADNGIGIDEAARARLFTPFVQADRSTTRRYGGTGLGLSISSRLIEMMGGTIAVCSEPGKGTTFTVNLSCALPGGVDSDGLRGDAARPLEAVPCLVCGDLAGAASDLARYLTHAGASVTHVPDRTQACDRIRQFLPGDCVCIVDDDDLLNALRAVARDHTDLHFVVVHDSVARMHATSGGDLVYLNRNRLHRSEFIDAVATAMNGADACAFEEPALDTEFDTMPSPLTEDQAHTSGRLILVAEDNEINQRVLLKQLALLGARAEVANNGRAAFDRWQHGRYALLLTDLHMPQMDGYDLCIAIREAEMGRARMPIIALTANALKGEANRCRAVGMDAYLTKPVKLEQLKLMLDRWLGSASVAPAAAPVLEIARPLPPASTASLDVSVLKALIGDDHAIVSEFLHDFQIMSADSAARLRAAVDHSRLEEVQAAAHKLKATARTVGALILADLCEQLETASAAGDAAALARCMALFELELAQVDKALSGPAG